MSLDSGYFERIWASSPDPWGFASRWYEQRKRALCVACLPDAHYGRVFEPGCATGLLTELLAERSDEVLATDIIDRPLEAARCRTAAHRHVWLQRRAVPWQWPEGQRFDLIVLSEIGYYFDDAALALLAEHTATALAPGATVLACHWRHPVAEHPTDAHEVHRVLGGRLGAVLAHHEEPHFLLDVYSAPGEDARAATGPLP